MIFPLTFFTVDSSERISFQHRQIPSKAAHRRGDLSAGIDPRISSSGQIRATDSQRNSWHAKKSIRWTDPLVSTQNPRTKNLRMLRQNEGMGALVQVNRAFVWDMAHSSFEISSVSFIASFFFCVLLLV